MGATLQALASLDGFVAELLLAARSAPQGSVAAALADCLREHRDGRGGESAQAVNPARLKHNLARHNLRFLGFAQQDAHVRTPSPSAPNPRDGCGKPWGSPAGRWGSGAWRLASPWELPALRIALHPKP